MIHSVQALTISLLTAALVSVGITTLVTLLYIGAGIYHAWQRHQRK